MSNDLNRCEFIGRLGSDPELRYTSGGSPVCNFRIACGQKWKDKQGSQKEKTEWVPVVAWGKLAEVCGKYLKKGSRIFVAGRFATKKWQGQDGQDRYTTEVVVDIGGTIQFLDSRPDSGQEQQAPQPSASAPAPTQAGGAGFDDDIPFAPIPSW